MSHPLISISGFLLPPRIDLQASPEQMRLWARAFQEALERHLSDIASSIVGTYNDLKPSVLDYYIPSITATSAYLQGTAAAAYVFPSETILTRLTVQADIGAGATLTVAVYNGTEVAGNIALSVSSAVVGRAALADVLPDNAGKEVFRPGDGTNPGDKCFIKVTSAGGTTSEISVQLQSEPA